MAFSNDLKIKLSQGFSSALNNAQKSGVAKNLHGAFNIAMISMLENLMVEMEDRMTNEEFIAELELSMANENKKAAVDLAAALQSELTKVNGDIALLESKVQDAVSKRAVIKPSKGG